MAIMVKSKEWWLNSVLTMHVHNDRNQFKNFKDMEDSEILMGSGNFASMQGIGISYLHFKSRNRLSLINFLYILSIKMSLSFYRTFV